MTEVSLTLLERQAAKRFQAACYGPYMMLSIHSNSGPVSWLIDGYRHECEAAGKGRLASAEGRTVNIPLRENDWVSQEIDGIEAGRFVFIFMTGKCEACGFKVVSEGHLDDTRRRPPLGRIQEVPV